jgi:hypothetical protein
MAQKDHLARSTGGGKKIADNPMDQRVETRLKNLGEQHGVGQGPVRVRRASVLRSVVVAVVVSTAG